MKKNRPFLTFCFLLIAGFGYAAEIPVADGGDLAAAIESAAAGDVIVLADGGIYECDELVLNKEITIKAAEGALVRPTIIALGATTFSFGRVGTHYGVKLQGIRLAAHVSRARVFYFGREDSISHLIMSDIVAHDYGASIIRAAEGGQEMVASLDSLVVENSYFYNWAWDRRESSFYLDRGDIETRYIKLYNSSFAGFYKKFLDCGAQQNKKTVIIDHINVVREDPQNGSQEEDLVELRSDTLHYSTITISNSIFGHQNGAKLFDFTQTETAIIDSMYNCHFFDIDTTGTMKNEWEYIDWTESDPLFTHDSVNAMYLSAGSPALTASTTGGPIGDSRWWQLPEPASLHNLKIDAGQYMRPMFRPDHYNYTATIPYSVGAINVIAEANFEGASITGDGEYHPDGGATETIEVVVTPEGGGAAKTYTIELTRELASTVSTLDTILVRTKTDTLDLDPVFNPETLTYVCELPLGSDTVYLEAETTDGSASVEFEDMVVVSLGNNMQSIVVTAQDTTAAKTTYEVNLKLCGTGTDAALTGITLDGDMIAGFDAGTLDYVEILEQGTTVVPVVDATASDPEAFVTITQAEDVNGTATILVEATDCSTAQTYTVEFKIDNTGVDENELGSLFMVHNPATCILSIHNAEEVEWVNIYAISGKLMVSEKLTAGGHIDIHTDALSHGIYLVQVNHSDGIFTGKFIK